MNTIEFYSVVDTSEIILFAVKIWKSIATQVCTHTHRKQQQKHILSHV